EPIDGFESWGGGFRRSGHLFLSARFTRILPLHSLELARERVDDALHGRLHFLVRQRAFEGLERETERQADLAVRDALAFIPIEFADLYERVGRGRPNGATNRIGRQGIRDENRHVAHDERVTRQCRGAARLDWRGGGHSVEV